jgi:hypothetical protein
LPAALLSADGFKGSALENPASFFEKKLEQKTLIQAFPRLSGSPCSLARKRLCRSSPWFIKVSPIYLAALNLVNYGGKKNQPRWADFLLYRKKIVEKAFFD